MLNKNLLLLLSLLLLNSTLLPAQKKLKTENVVLVTLDGFRWREVFTGADPQLIADKELVADAQALKTLFWDDDPQKRRQKLLPFVWTTLAAEGQLYGNRQHQNKVNLRNKHHFSYPGYNEILTGFADPKIDSNDKKDNPNQTVLEYINQQEGFQGKVAAFGSWDVFPYILNTQRSGLPVNAGFDMARGPNLTEREKFLNQLQAEVPRPWANVRLDAFTHHYAREYTQKNAPRVVYLAYGETDDFAHNGNYEAYLKSAHQTDAFLRDLWTWLQQTPAYQNKTTLIITTDHGRGTTRKAWQDHGATVAEAEQTWLMVLGPDTPALGEQKQPAQYHTDQIAATLAALLGLPYTTGRPVGEVIKATMGN